MCNPLYDSSWVSEEHEERPIVLSLSYVFLVNGIKLNLKIALILMEEYEERHQLFLNPSYFFVNGIKLNFKLLYF